MKKKIAIICVLLLGICLSTNADNSPNGDKSAEIVVFSGGRPHRLAEVQPQGWFYRDTRMLPLSSLPRGLCPTPCRCRRTMSHSTTR